MANILMLKEPRNQYEHQKFESEFVRIRKEIRDRVDGCFTSNCWILKEGDSGQLYIPKILGYDTYTVTQIRRYLFYTTWKQVPDRRKLYPLCKHSRCQNPAHMTYRGFKPPYNLVLEMLNVGWLTEAQAKEWFAHK